MVIGLLLVAVSVSTGFFVGGKVATGNWNPFGNHHYYAVLNANVGVCYTHEGTQSCESTHNVLFNAGALWVEQVIQDGSGYVGCTVSATCAMKYIGLSGGGTAPAATDSVTGATNGDCGKPTDTELTTNGMARAIGTVTDISGSSPQSSTVVKTFTDATGASTVQKACLLNTATQGSANNVQLAAATFSAVTLQVGDTIQVTWTIAYTWS